MSSVKTCPGCSGERFVLAEGNIGTIRCKMCDGMGWLSNNDDKIHNDDGPEIHAAPSVCDQSRVTRGAKKKKRFI